MEFLFFTGYLKKVGERREERTIYITMTVPNEEVAYIYENSVLAWFDKKVKNSDRKPLYKSLLSGDAGRIRAIPSEI